MIRYWLTADGMLRPSADFDDVADALAWADAWPTHELYRYRRGVGWFLVPRFRP